MITISIKNYKNASSCYRSDDWDFNENNDMYKILYIYDDIVLGERIGIEYTNFYIPTDTIILLANIPSFIEYSSETLITLDSIINQTFTDWECILVDDRSADESIRVLQEYQKKDARFKAFLRPLSLKKGANSCRNYGFLQATGSYIKWFDSDDLMQPKHLA